MAQYTPIASKDFGIDLDSSLNKQLWVWQINIDKKSNKIVVIYDIVLLSPTGNIVVILLTDSYIRDNQTSAQNFASLQAGPLGEGITLSIDNDLSKIQSFETINNDLIEQ